MDSPRFRRVQELFSEAVERTESVRGEFLDDECGHDVALRTELDRLLQAHAATAGFLDDRELPGESAGDRIDRYKLLECIGEGGFGVVWMAEQQEPVVRRVALKVVKPGMDTRDVLTRFEAERQAIAIMDHPNIARVFDAGATPQGRPYFVMELVRGEPLIEFADRERLSSRARIALFGQVCSAVQHAHQKGVVHRDLKPSNVMVTLIDGEPVCKVIDFGIAKATERRLVEKTMFTAFGRFLGTPEYMAPEQTEISGLDVDTRADVYSLGVLLYELLTGTRPIDFRETRKRDYVELMRAVRDDDPPRPSTRVSTLGDRSDTVAECRHTTVRQLGSELRGDLDWVIMRALEKDRRRRYQTVSALADDLHRVQRCEPVTAGPPSRIYRVRKFVARNRTLVLASAITTAALVAGLVVAVAALIEARDSRDAALESARVAALESEKSGSLVKLLTDMLDASNPQATRGADFTVRELLSQFDAQMDASLDAAPEVESHLRFVVGKSFGALGLLQDAESQFERALALRTAAFGADDPRTVEALARLGATVLAGGDPNRAETMLKRALATRRATLPPEHPLIAELLAALGEVASERGDAEAAEALHRESLAMRRATLAPRHRDLAKGMNDLATVLMQKGAADEASVLWRDACEIMDEVVGAEHPNTLTVHANLATALLHERDFVSAEAEFRRVLEGFRNVSGSVHPSVAMTLENLAVALMRQSRFDEAETALDHAISIWQQLAAPGHSASARQHLAIVLLELGRAAEAETVLRETIAIYAESGVPGTDPRVRWAVADLEKSLRLQGKPSDVR